MALKLVYVIAEGDFEKGIARMHEPIAKAATLAVRDAGDMAKTSGRSAIAAAGFGTKWQNAYRMKSFPGTGKFSVNAAAFLWHKIPYAYVFQLGATIRGKPTLWIPLRNAPEKIGGKRPTPELYNKIVGPLFPIKRPGKPTLLAAKVRQTSGAASRSVQSISAGKLRRGTAGKRGTVQSVPIFVGVDSVTLRKQFDLDATAKRASDRLPSLYFQYLQAD